MRCAPRLYRDRASVYNNKKDSYLLCAKWLRSLPILHVCIYLSIMSRENLIIFLPTLRESAILEEQCYATLAYLETLYVTQNGHYISPFLVAIQKSRTFIISSCTWAFLCLYIAVCTLSCLHFRIMTLFVFFVCVLSFFLIFVFWNFCSLIICLMNIKWFSTVTNSQTYFFFTLFAICAVFQFSLNFVINDIYILGVNSFPIAANFFFCILQIVKTIDYG